MPIYEYECGICERREEKICYFSEKPDWIECKECQGIARSIISGGADRRAWDPYWDENLGDQPVLVESREHREKLKKKAGLHDQYHRKRGMPGQWV